MSLNHEPADVIVVGGGPAGSAAAITAARLGLGVVLVEAARFPRFRPGETLASSTGSLIERLIGKEALSGLSKLHFPHIHRAPNADADRSPQATDAPGFHIQRSELDVALLGAATRAGARLRQPACATKITVDGVRRWKVRTTQGDLRCRFVIDASGSTQWLARATCLDTLILSEPLEVQYQYGSRINAPPIPSFAISPEGWQWTATLPGDWELRATMGFPGQPASIPMRAYGNRATRRSICTWRIASQMAAANFALAGDAACHLDPASSHGVLRALASGIAAAEAASKQLQGHLAGEDALLGYCRWITGWFLDDCRSLHTAYRLASRLPDPVGFAKRCQIFYNLEDDHGA